MSEWYTWVFSGIGVFAIAFFVQRFSRSANRKLKQRSGDHSVNFQVGGDIDIKESDDGQDS